MDFLWLIGLWGDEWMGCWWFEWDGMSGMNGLKGGMGDEWVDGW